MHRIKRTKEEAEMLPSIWFPHQPARLRQSDSLSLCYRKLHGVAVRVPVAVGSLVDLVTVLRQEVTIDKVNNAMKHAANNQMTGFFKYTEDPIVSTDIVGDPHSSIFDALSTMVMSGKMLKTFSWYDNEWAFSHRMVDMLKRMF
jgi:glyceraldehyde 3-phosphate dehydrogenase